MNVLKNQVFNIFVRLRVIVLLSLFIFSAFLIYCFARVILLQDFDMPLSRLVTLRDTILALVSIPALFSDFAKYIYSCFGTVTIYDIYVYCSARIINSSIAVWESVMDRFRCSPPQTLFFYFILPDTLYCTYYNTLWGVTPVLSSFDTYIVYITCTLVSMFIFRVYYNCTSGIALGTLLYTKLALFVFSCAQGAENYQWYKQVFHDTPLISVSPSKNHSHGTAAASRGAASKTARSIATSLGKRPYFYQMSRSDQKSNYVGCRSYYWAKDFTVDPRDDPICDYDLVVMIDVDYYMDMPAFLATHFKPVILYSFQPSQTGRVSADYSYSFQNDKCDYRVTGGGVYSHLVWDYQQDTVTVELTVAGLRVKYCTYLVERRTIDEDHELILLIPLRKWTVASAWLTRMLTDTPLKRFKLAVGEFNRLAHFKQDELSICTSYAGQTSCVVIPATIDEEIVNMAKLSKNVLGYPTVAQLFAKNNIVGQDHGAKILTAYAQANAKKDAVIVSLRNIVPKVFHYQFAKRHYDQDSKQSMVAYMNPLSYPPFVPLQSMSNEYQMIKGRVTDIQVKLTDEIPMFVADCIEDFILQFIPKEIANTFQPSDRDMLFEKQCRATQRNILNQTEFDDPEQVGTLSTFMKKEPYSGPKDPRNITTYPGAIKAEYGQFIYSLADHLKTMAWYAFGKTPLEIAETLTDVALNADFITTSDGSRWDGHISKVVRLLELKIGVRAFAREFTERFSILHGKQYNNNGKSTNGVKFRQGYSRGSGSMETSVFNSIVNKFISYLATRMTKKQDGTYYTSTEAFDMPGMFGGDDGASANVSAETLCKAAALVGQAYESEEHYRGDPVKFLSRVYTPQIWFGSPDSVCSIDRSLRNFSLTVALDSKVTPQMKLLEKSRAYYLTDRNTPLVGDFVCAVLRIVGEDNLLGCASIDNNLGVGSYDSIHFKEEVQYPNAVHDVDWQALGVPDTINAELFIMHCQIAVSLDDLLNFPMYDTRALLGEERVPTDIIINNDVCSTFSNAAVVDIDLQTQLLEKLPVEVKTTTALPEKTLAVLAGCKTKDCRNKVTKEGARICSECYKLLPKCATETCNNKTFTGPLCVKCRPSDAKSYYETHTETTPCATKGCSKRANMNEKTKTFYKTCRDCTAENTLKKKPDTKTGSKTSQKGSKGT
jgi:hypothetical protein